MGITWDTEGRSKFSGCKRNGWVMWHCQEKNCPPKKFYPRTKFFSDCGENFCPTLKIFVHLAKFCLPDFSSALHVSYCIIGH